MDYRMNDLMFKVYLFITLVISLSIHEFAHAYSAYRAGDDTAKRAGRMTVNPIAHFDIIGFIFLVLMAFSRFPFAYGKPVPVDPSNYKNPRRDDILVSLWGPLSNICLAIVSAIIFRFFKESSPESLLYFLLIMVQVNISLAIFNLIPIYPLDGSHILLNLLPWKTAQAYTQFMQRYFVYVFIGLIIVINTPLGHIFSATIFNLTKLLIGF